VWLIVVLQAFLTFAMIVLYPAFQEPDEVAHVDYVLAHRHGDWFDGPGERAYQTGVIAARKLVPDSQFRTHVGGGTPPPRSSRKSFDALGAGPLVTPFTDQMVQHPPLYYALAAGFSYLLPDFPQHRFDVQILWLRLFSLLLLLPVPVLIFNTARRLTGNENLALVAALMPLSMPSFLRTGASVTNDSVLVLFITVVVALLARVAWGDLSRRTALLVGLAWGGALLTKGFALALPPAIVLAYLVGAREPLRPRIVQAWPGAVIAGAVGSAIGGWWWIRNVIVYGVVQPAGLGPLPDSLRQLALGHDRPGGGEVDFFGNFFRLLGQRMWGSLGLIDIPTLPHLLLRSLSLSWVLLVVAATVLGTGAFGGRVRGGISQWNAGRAITLIVPTVLIMAVMYFGARGTYLRGRQLPGIQARYLLPAVLGVAICVAVSLCVLAGRFERWLPPILLTGAFGFLAASVFRVLDIEMSSANPDRVRRLTDALHFLSGWSALPTKLTALLLATTVALAAVSVVAFWVGAARSRPPTPEIADAAEVSSVPA